MVEIDRKTPEEIPETAAPRLQMRNIRKRFGATVALAGVSFAVRPGEVHALIGQNGAGKSTLMKTLSGAIAPDEGDMLLDGHAYRPRTPLDGRRLGVAMIYQELAQAPHMTVAENILLGLEPGRFGFVNRAAMRQTAKSALEQLGHGHLNLQQSVGELSPATQQIIEIARALAVGCRVLVLDEPTSSLTGRDVDSLFATIRRLKSQGLAIVYISHFLEEIKSIADRFTVLRDGQSVGGGDVAAVPAGRMVELMVGQTVEQLYPRTARTPGDVVLTIDKLSGAAKPHEVSLELRAGEVLGIAGLVGAGRTELLRTIFGLDAVKTGTIRAGALRLRDRSPRQRWLAGLGMLSEDRKNEGLATSLSIADNITLSDLERVGKWGWIFPKIQRTQSARWSTALGIKARSVFQNVGELSGGNQQKVAIARLLHHDVDVLLLDEPTRGIDVGAKAAIYKLIDDLAHTQKKAILVVSSYFPELLGICDRIAVMQRGRLVATRPAAEWSEHELVQAASGATNEPEGVQ